MLIDDLKSKNDFTNTECSIADYILEHLDEIPSQSTEVLAKNTFTSKAAITRFCKKLNVGGYHEFQKRLEWEKRELNRLEGLISEEPIKADTTVEEIVDILPTFYDSAIEDTKMNLNVQILKRCINRLKRAEMIDIYGMGITATIAKMAAFKFQSIGYEAHIFDGINEHYIMRDQSKNKRVAIVLSLTGGNPMMTYVAKYLREQGIYVIGIGAEGAQVSSPLKDCCNEYLSFARKREILSLEAVTSITTVNYIIDILFSALLVEHYQENVDASIDVIKNRKY